MADKKKTEDLDLDDLFNNIKVLIAAEFEKQYFVVE